MASEPEAKLFTPPIARSKATERSQTHHMSRITRHNFEDLRRELVSRKYSYKTVKGYLYYNRDFLNLVNKAPHDVTESDIKDYLLYLAEDRQSATSKLNQAIDALKFYME